MDAGTVMLRQMTRARRFNRWMAQTIAPFIGQSVLEIGAGIGNLTALLCSGRQRYVATDTDETHLSELRTRLSHFPHLEVHQQDATKPNSFSSFDTAVCLNVLEHIPDDEAALANICSALQPTGRAIVLVPQGQHAFGSLDEVLGHRRRYSRTDLAKKMYNAGFDTERVLAFNRASYPGWVLNSRILRRRTLSGLQLGLFDLAVPLLRHLDRYLPWPPTSLIAIGVRRS